MVSKTSTSPQNASPPLPADSTWDLEERIRLLLESIEGIKRALDDWGKRGAEAPADVVRWKGWFYFNHLRELDEGAAKLLSEAAARGFKDPIVDQLAEEKGNYLQIQMTFDPDQLRAIAERARTGPFTPVEDVRRELRARAR